LTLAALVASVDADRLPGVNLSSALRLFVLAQVKQAQGDSN
jgi:predicted DNA-binding ribbon-helix-helix protein